MGRIARADKRVRIFSWRKIALELKTTLQLRTSDRLLGEPSLKFCEKGERMSDELKLIVFLAVVTTRIMMVGQALIQYLFKSF